MNVGVALRAFLVAGLVAIRGISTAQEGADELERLAHSAEDFLTRWLLEGDPAAAVESHYSRLEELADAGFVPGRYYDLEAYQDLFGTDVYRVHAHALSIAELHRPITEYLTRLRNEELGNVPGGEFRREMLVSIDELESLNRYGASWKSKQHDCPATRASRPSRSTPGMTFRGPPPRRPPIAPFSRTSSESGVRWCAQSCARFRPNPLGPAC